MAVERITVTGEGSSIKVLVRTTPAAGVSDADVAAAIAAAVLDDLADVTSPSPGDGQVLTWDAGTSRWVPATGGGGAVDSVNGHTGTVVLGAADVGAAPSARTLVAGVGLSGGGDLSVDRTFDVDYGTTAGTAAEGDDVRLSDARTPTAHHASHENGGADELALDASQVTSGTVGTARLGTGTADNTTYLRGDQTWAAVTPGASALNDLTDVDTATDPPATDDVLAWNGTLWTPAGLTAADTGAIPETLIDAKGDLIVGTANDTAARLGVGTDGQVLTADSAETSGVKWAAPAGGGAVDSVNGQTGVVVLAAADVGADPAGTAAGLVDDLSGVSNAATARTNLGLGNVDNTSDANKPVSTAQQTALDGKAAASHSHSGADITSGTVATARLGSGTANATTFLRGDQTWAAAGGGGGVTEVRMTTTFFHSSDGPANNPRPVGITTSHTRGRSILSPFTATGTTQVFGGVPWLPWSTVDIWIDFLNTNASAGDVKWQVAFGGQAGAHTQLTLYAATVAVTAASGNETTYGQRYTQKIASAVAVATTDMLDCQVVRLGDDAADTLAGSVWLKQLRFREAGT